MTFDENVLKGQGTIRPTFALKLNENSKCFKNSRLWMKSLKKHYSLRK